MTRLLFVLIAASSLIACGDDYSGPAEGTGSGDATTANATCAFSGKTYSGPDGQGGEPTDGCEGCGNPGSIDFESATDAVLTLPGDDVMQSCTYSQAGRTLRLNCEGSAHSFQISDNCQRLNGGAGSVFVVQ